MFRAAADDSQGLYVFLFTGGESTDADYAAYLAQLEHIVDSRAGASPGLAVLIVDPGNQPPNAVWRARLAEVSARAPVGTGLALVTDSPLVRGVATALRWIRPQQYSRSAHSSFAEAAAWLASLRPGVEARLHELHAEVRAPG